MVSNDVQEVIGGLGEVGNIFDVETPSFDGFSQYILEKLELLVAPLLTYWTTCLIS